MIVLYTVHWICNVKPLNISKINYESDDMERNVFVCRPSINRQYLAPSNNIVDVRFLDWCLKLVPPQASHYHHRLLYPFLPKPSLKRNYQGSLLHKLARVEKGNQVLLCRDRLLIEQHKKVRGSRLKRTQKTFLQEWFSLLCCQQR